MFLLEDTLLQGGKYKIVRFLSSGGFGNTYEGVHTLRRDRSVSYPFFSGYGRDEAFPQDTDLSPVPPRRSVG